MACLHFQAIRMSGNKLTDKLVNKGTARTLRLNSRAWKDLEDGDLRCHCASINEFSTHLVFQSPSHQLRSENSLNAGPSLDQG